MSSALMRVLGCALAVAGGWTATASAQPTTDRGSSIVLFPLVIADASADTIIQLGNVSDSAVAARCAYVDGSSGAWLATAFAVELGPQQPLYWTAAQGRSDTMPPIDVPAAPPGFRGELLCVQTFAGAPSGASDLVGQASVHDLGIGDVAAYVAVGLQGIGINDSDDVLCVGGDPSDRCIIGAEYDPCPAEWILSVPADGSADGQLGAGSALSSRLTIVPCSQNLRDAEPATVTVTVDAFNELGQQLSGSVEATCWSDVALGDLAGGLVTPAMLGSDFAQVRLRPAAGSGGFMVVARTTRTSADTTLAGTAAFVPQRRGSAAASDLIILPRGAIP